MPLEPTPNTHFVIPYNSVVGTGFIGLRIGTVEGAYEYGNE
jgi:hypothetical protein